MWPLSRYVELIISEMIPAVAAWYAHSHFSQEQIPLFIDRPRHRHESASAADLLRIGTQLGYQALAIGEMWRKDHVFLNAHDPSLAGISDDLLADAVIFGATPRAVDEVIVNGKQIVQHGWHIHYDEIRRAYEKMLRKLLG